MEKLFNSSAFILAGINTTEEEKNIYFGFVFLYFLTTVFINLALIVTIYLSEPLHEPMYIFLGSLCVNGLYGTAAFYPKFLYDIFSGTHEISYAGCLLQVLVIYSSALCDVYTLTVMAYDRTVAICRPLEYHTIMTRRTVLKLLAFAWVGPVFSMSVLMLLTNRLTLCGRQINKLYCETWAVVKLSCSSTTLNNVFGYIVIFSYLANVFFILFSYGKLVKTCTKSKENQKKFMQTCTPHVLTLFNVTIAFMFDVMYSRYGSADFPQSLRTFLSLEFLFVPPLLNPLIYGLKLNQVRIRVLGCFKKNAVNLQASHKADLNKQIKESE